MTSFSNLLSRLASCAAVAALVSLLVTAVIHRGRLKPPAVRRHNSPSSPPPATARHGGQVTQSVERDDELIARILDIMENTTAYCDPGFGVTQLTAMVGSNIGYVPRVIKARLGKSVPMLINEYRVREACRRMRDRERYGHYTLQAIAESVGFKSQNNFINMFKRVTGTTPSLFLKAPFNPTGTGDATS